MEQGADRTFPSQGPVTANFIADLSVASEEVPGAPMGEFELRNLFR